MPFSLPDGFWTIAKQLFIGGVAAAVHYLYLVAKGVNFEWVTFFLNFAIGSFIGWVAGEFLGENVPYHNGFVALAGISAFEIMRIIEEKPKEILNLLNKVKK